MRQLLKDLLSNQTPQRDLAQWARALSRMERRDTAELNQIREQAKTLRDDADDILRRIDGILLRPTVRPRLPKSVEWMHVPTLWSRPVIPAGWAGAESGASLCDDTTIFHDCPISEAVVRQTRNNRPDAVAPFSVSIDVLRFEGSFLSLVVELPPEAVSGLKTSHIIGLDIAVDRETDATVFARLNVRHGPNEEQVIRKIEGNAGHSSVEFDLGFVSLDERRVERMWLDLIFDHPRMDRIRVENVCLKRRLRADL